jgi:hypothetical protein
MTTTLFLWLGKILREVRSKEPLTDTDLAYQIDSIADLQHIPAKDINYRETTRKEDK